MANLLAFEMGGIWIVKNIIGFFNRVIKTIKSNPIERPPQPQPQPQPQPVQLALVIEPMENEQASFLFDEEFIDEKNCPNCERILPFTSFRVSSKHEDGFTKWCADCLSTPREPKQSNKKHCPSCKKNRLKTSFYKNSKQPDGLTKWCKTCMDRSKR